MQSLYTNVGFRAVATIEDTEVMTSVFFRPKNKIIIRAFVAAQYISLCGRQQAMNSSDRLTVLYLKGSRTLGMRSRVLVAACRPF